MLPLMKPTGFLAAKVLTSSLSFIGIRAYEEGLVVRNPTIFSRGRLRREKCYFFVKKVAFLRRRCQNNSKTMVKMKEFEPFD